MAEAEGSSEVLQKELGGLGFVQFVIHAASNPNMVAFARTNWKDSSKLTPLKQRMEEIKQMEEAGNSTENINEKLSSINAINFAIPVGPNPKVWWPNKY
mmetsp:Transcript_54871/g.87642  ORF Transcript_54871/g.87642 Transcript_54871/m.87642 type:complete len:99 (+) Transcript_54871:19-315(+)